MDTVDYFTVLYACIGVGFVAFYVGYKLGDRWAVRAYSLHLQHCADNNETVVVNEISLGNSEHHIGDESGKQRYFEVTEVTEVGVGRYLSSAFKGSGKDN